jgi:hypothetical protein
MKVFTVKEPVFKVEPLFVLGCTHEALAAYLQRRFRVTLPSDPENAFVLGRMYTFDGPPWRVVWTLHGRAPETLHETFHLVTRVCADRGITIRAHNEHHGNDDETAAYLFEYFARAVLRRCR